MKARHRQAKQKVSKTWLIGLLTCLTPLVEGAPRDSVNVDLTEVPLEQLMFDYRIQSVFGASKHEQKVSEAPSSITLVDSEEISFYGHRNLAEILESVRGLYVSNDRNYSYLGVRGFNRPGDYSSRVLVLVNGHRTNENVFDSVLIGYEFPLDIDMISRVEVIRGPSSSIYGNNAFFGVINVITKDPTALNGVKVSTSLGSFEAKRLSLTYGATFKNNVRWVISGTLYDSDGHDSLYYPEYNTSENRINNGITRDTDYEHFGKFFSSLTFGDFVVEASLSSRTKGIPTGSYGTIFNDDGAKTKDAFAWVDVKYERELTDNWRIVGRIGYDQYDYDGDYPLQYEDLSRVIYSDYAIGKSLTSEIQLTTRLRDRHTLTFGAEQRFNFNQDQGNKDTYVPQTKYDDHRSTQSTGLYGQAEIMVAEKLLLNAGLRFDHFGTFGETTNPRLALIYNPVEATTIKVLYGTAFKAPNAYELYYSGPNNKGNRHLTPERIDTYEVVLEQSLNKTITFLASAFTYDIDDLINQTLDPADELLIYVNSDRVNAKGLEFELTGTTVGNIRGRMSLTVQRTTDDFTGEQLSNSPRELAKFNVSFPIVKERLFSGVEVQYRGSTRTLRENTVESYWLANVTLFSRNLVEGLDASVGVYNVFNQTYAHPGAGEHLQDAIQQDGRTFRVKFTYRF